MANKKIIKSNFNKYIGSDHPLSRDVESTYKYLLLSLQKIHKRFLFASPTVLPTTPREPNNSAGSDPATSDVIHSPSPHTRGSARKQLSVSNITHGY